MATIADKEKLLAEEEKNNLVNSKQTTRAEAGQADNSNKYAIAGASAFIFNDKGELLLTRSPQWKNLWVVPGGKIEFGENMADALRREIKEETNLEIKNINFLKTIELNKTKERPDLHLVVNEYLAKVDGEGIVKLNSEHNQYDWRKPEEWLKEKELYPSIRQAIEYYLDEFLINQDLEYKYKRALADYQNLLKQTAKEKEEFVKFANLQLLYEIIPVYDNLKTSLQHTNQSTNNHGWLEGVKHVVRQFKEVLNNFGVEEIETKDKKFDHDFMEAVDEERTKDKELDGLVAKEVKAGYMLNGKVIIPARVVVYKYK